MKLISCVVLAIGLSSIASAQVQSQEESLRDVKTPPADTIEGLRQQQIKVLESVAVAKRAEFNAGTLPSWVVARCYEKLARARLSAAKSPSKRVAHAEELVTNLKSLLDVTIERFEFGVEKLTDALDAKAAYLEAEILLREEKQKADDGAGGASPAGRPTSGARSGRPRSIDLLKEPAAGTIAKLHRQLIELLTIVADAQEQSYKAGSINYIPLVASRVKLTRAQLAAARESTSRVKYAESLVAILEEAVSTDRDLFRGGMGKSEHEADYLEAKVLLLEEKQRAAVEREKEQLRSRAAPSS